MRPGTILLIAVTAALTAGASAPARADAASWLYPLLATAAADDRHDREDRRRDHRDRDELRLSGLERELIRDYFRDREWDRDHRDHRDHNRGDRGDYNRGRDYRALPPGLQKQVARGRGLPPGWQKKVARGEVLPGDVYRYRSALPDDLLRRLPSQPRGTELYRIDDDIVRVMTGTRIVADILGL